MGDVSFIPLSLFHASVCCVSSVAVLDGAALFFLTIDVPCIPISLFHTPLFSVAQLLRYTILFDARILRPGSCHRCCLVN